MKFFTEIFVNKKTFLMKSWRESFQATLCSGMEISRQEVQVVGGVLVNGGSRMHCKFAIVQTCRPQESKTQQATWQWFSHLLQLEASLFRGILFFVCLLLYQDKHGLPHNNDEIKKQRQRLHDQRNGRWTFHPWLEERARMVWRFLGSGCLAC